MARAREIRWDDGLVGAARRIAEADHSPIRVMAGPGTGKTFALMRRVARLLQEGVDGARMLVCTFTRTAARDLQCALTALGLDGTEDVRAGTLHSFCFGLLSGDEVLEATGRTPRPLLHFEERFLLEDLKGDGFRNIGECKKRLQAFNAAWARLQSDEPGWPDNRIDQDFQRMLLGWLRFHEAMVIGEIIPVTLNYLRDNPASSSRAAFDHVLVDEYQDLNRAEQVLLDILSESGNLIVIGDEDQSIYSFRFAHPEGITTFDETHTDTLDEDLDECRRCPTMVVEMANALIANNESRNEERELQPARGCGEGEVLVLQWHSLEEETLGIAELISRRIRNGDVDAGHVLVLAPRRQMGYAIRAALNNLGVYAHSFFHEEALEGNPTGLEQSKAQQAFALLTLLANPEDRVALRCWCGFGSNSLRARPWALLRQHCETSGESPWTALERLAAGDLSIARTGQLVQRFRELRQKLSELDNLQGQELVDALFPPGQEGTNLIRSLAATIEGEDYDAGALREALRIGITQPELPTDVDYVRVMSLHKSKGLTADLVVVVGCMEGLIPLVNGNSISEQNRSLEEQRRLFYVAITRTRNILVLSSVTELLRRLAHRMRVKVRSGNRTHARTIASQFLNELGPSRPAAVLGDSTIEVEGD
jgi:DNA helicase-2/ATP-dependent DNA helicase PcrA